MAFKKICGVLGKMANKWTTGECISYLLTIPFAGLLVGNIVILLVGVPVGIVIFLISILGILFGVDPIGTYNVFKPILLYVYIGLLFLGFTVGFLHGIYQLIRKLLGLDNTGNK